MSKVAARTVKVPRIQYRNFEVEVEPRAEGAEGEIRLYPLSFSSEAPARRFSWDTWEDYDEVLSHEPGDIDLSRAKNGLPLIKSHQRLLHFGSVTDVSLDEKRKRLRGMAAFSSIPLGQEQETMLREGHIKTVSVGYQVLSMEMVSKDNKTGIATYRCTWMPYEVSTEPIPADYKVGFGRTRAEARAGAGDVELVEFTIDEAVMQGERAMDPKAGAGPLPADGNRGNPTPTPPAPVLVETRDRGAEIQEIYEMCQEYGQLSRAQEWVRQGLTPDQIGKEILKAVRTQGTGQPAAEFLDRAGREERKNLDRYSYARALRLAVELKEGERSKYDGVEGEMHQELARHRGPQHGGILIPWRLRSTEQHRAMGTTEPTGGATLVGTQVIPDMIEYLRNSALVLIAGARFYTGLTANIQFNKETADPTVYWMDENPAAGAAASQPQYGYVDFGPKTLIGRVEIPRQLLVQAGIDVDADVKKKLGFGHALAFDRAALHGKGTDKQPLGLYSAADVQSKAMGGVPTFVAVVEAEGQIADKNADMGALSWMTTPLMAAKLMTVQVVSGQAKMVWDGNFREGQMAGYTARATNQILKTLGAGANEHGMLYGNWNDLVVCQWGNDLEVVVDPYTKADKGQIAITSYSMGDCGPVRPQSFVKATGATIS